MTTSIRGAGRRLAQWIPDDRRVKGGLGGASGRRALQLRKLVAPLFQRPVVLRTRDGLRLRVTADPVDEMIAQHVLGPRHTDYFPPWAHRAPARLTILDIGAHHGLYAVAALHTYEDSTIICVEPSLAAVQCLRENLALNGSTGRARIVNAGLAPLAGPGVLRHSAEGSWGASLFEEEEATTDVERVDLESLDVILGGARPDVIKCNAEGAEYTLFDQLEASDVRPSLMVVMVHPEFGDMARLLDQSERMGYRLTRIGTEERPAFQMWLLD